MAKKTPPPFSALHPYRSFLFLQVADRKDGRALVNPLLTEIGKIVAEEGNRLAYTAVESKTENGLRTGYATYACKRQCSWTSDPSFEDVANHVVVVSAFGPTFALFVSEDRLRDQISAALAEGQPALFGKLSRIPVSRLNAAFVKGEPRTLWLSATHRQTSRKPDRKVLSGIDLRDALNPLDDQSFFFTAARCRQADKAKTTYGISPKKSTVWIGPSKSWTEYRDSALSFLKALNVCTDDERSPLPILASSADVALDEATLGPAFEVSLEPEDAPAEPQTVGAMSEGAPISSEMDLELIDCAPPSLTVRATDSDGLVGTCRLHLSRAADGVEWSVGPESDNEADVAIASRVSGRRSALRAWFDLGFMVSDGGLFETHFRDLPFNGFKWENFDECCIRTEKPDPISASTIGAQKSLFCWLLRKWTSGDLDWLPRQGWLACNDGAMEIADFIHFSGGDAPTLTLIHIKAAKSKETNRTVRVTPYEIVVSQALKNLRHLDARITSRDFSSGVSAALRPAVWKDGRSCERQAMSQAIKDCGARAARRVVVVQPHTLRSKREAVLIDGTSSDRRRLSQLHTLLCAAQGECAALGAEFLSIGDGQ